MDTNQKQNNQQTNTFTGGMNTDTSDMYMKSDLYRYAENLRIISDNDSTTGELHLIEGTKEITADYEKPKDWEEKEDVVAYFKYCMCRDDYDVNEFYIILRNGVITDNYYQEGDDVEIVVFLQEDGMSLYRDVDGTHIELESPYKVTVGDFTNERLGWSFDGNILNKNYKHWSIEEFVNGRISPYSHNMDADDMSAFVYILYINKTQKYCSKVVKNGATKSEMREYFGNQEITIIENHWMDWMPLSSRESQFEILKQEPFDALTGTILDVNYIKNICTIIEEKEGLWYIDLYDYEQNKLFLIAGPFGEPIWEDAEDIGKKKILSTTLIWEADDNIKLYIADGVHELMSVKIQKGSDGKYKRIEGSFTDVFLASSMLLPPLDVQVGDKAGQIEHVKVQYAYILYKSYGKASALSSLSNWLSLYDTETKGFAKGATTNKSVTINIPQVRSSNTDSIRIYRISYESAGQQPTVNVIYDSTHYPGRTIVDYGTNIQSISISELIALSSSGVIPKLIEQKNNYLFAANVKYEQDEANKIFNGYDMRCFTSGDYVILDSSEVHFNYGSNLDLFLKTDIDDIKNAQLDNNVWRWNRSDWYDVTGGYSTYNGLGKWLGWKYKFNNYSGNYYNNNPKTTYFRNEVYRFGIRFFDSKGRPSSVKWIADIKMPDYGMQNEDNIRNGVEAGAYGNGVDIEFQPINTDVDGSPWKLASAYEILQCVRTTNDSFGLTQGIVSFPLCAENAAVPGGEDHSQESKKLCVPYLMTLRGAWVERKYQYEEHHMPKTGEKYYSLHRSYLLFASPEECYQQDDIDAILKSGSSNYYIVPIFKFLHDPFVLRYTLAGNDMYTAQLGSNPQLPICNGGDEYGIGAYYVDKMGRESGNHPYGHFAFSAKFKRSTDSTSALEFINSNDTRIKNYTVIKSQDLRKFYNGNTVSATYSSTAVGDGGVIFYNWSGPCMVETISKNEITRDDDSRWLYLRGDWGTDAEQNSWEHFQIELWRTPIGAGGKYLLITPTDKSIFTDTADSNNPNPNVTVCQIYKKGVTPYGGRNKGAINDSKYIPIAYSYNVTGSVEAKAGDGYMSDFEFNHLHYVHNDIAFNMNTCRVVYQLPIESHIDLKGQSSDYLYSTEDRIQDEADSVKSFAQTTGLYMYNTAYNITPNSIVYSPNDEEGKTTEYANRVHYSLPKTNNELIDSWTQFKIVSDFIDVDTRYGEITGLKLFKDKLIFMLQKAAGVLSSNDRTIINDADGNNIILGNGGVLLRYDYITTLYGMKPDQKTYTTSNEALYWWDGYNKEIIQYLEGYNINQLQHQKLIDSYIQSKDESETPEVFYDRRNKEVVFNVVGDESVVFNEKAGQFISVYKFCPIYHCDLINGQVLIKDNKIYEYNKADNGESSLFGKKTTPLLQYVVNNSATYNKVFDTQQIGGRFYGGSEVQDDDSRLPYLLKGEHNNTPLSNLLLRYNTPLKQLSTTNGSVITNYEYEYRLTIPRNGDNALYGNRMRGNTMQCELKSSSNDLDFSLQYIITKYRISWT